MKKIIIITKATELDWYRYSIGKSFEVLTENEDFYFIKTQYEEDYILKINAIDFELMPCPHCGKQPVYHAQEPYHFTFIGGWTSEVEVSCCASMTKTYGESAGDTSILSTVEAATSLLVEQWNKRT